MSKGRRTYENQVTSRAGWTRWIVLVTHLALTGICTYIIFSEEPGEDPSSDFSTFQQLLIVLMIWCISALLAAKALVTSIELDFKERYVTVTFCRFFFWTRTLSIPFDMLSFRYGKDFRLFMFGKTLRLYLLGRPAMVIRTDDFGLDPLDVEEISDLLYGEKISQRAGKWLPFFNAGWLLLAVIGANLLMFGIAGGAITAKGLLQTVLYTIIFSFVLVNLFAYLRKAAYDLFFWD